MFHIYLDRCKCDKEAKPRRQVLGRGYSGHRIQLRSGQRQLLKTKGQKLLHVRYPDDCVILGQCYANIACLWAVGILKTTKCKSELEVCVIFKHGVYWLVHVSDDIRQLKATYSKPVKLKIRCVVIDSFQQHVHPICVHILLNAFIFTQIATFAKRTFIPYLWKQECM